MELTSSDDAEKWIQPGMSCGMNYASSELYPMGRHNLESVLRGRKEHDLRESKNDEGILRKHTAFLYLERDEHVGHAIV